MKLRYYPETESLYIELSPEPGVDAIEVTDGVVADIGADGRIVGLDIDNTAAHIDLSKLEAIDLPVSKAS